MGLHPARLVERACREHGPDAVVSWCIGLLHGDQTAESSDFDIGLLGGTTGWPPYWSRVWGCRGLLYAWDQSAASIVVGALADEHWRVREMAAKVCRLRELGESADAVAVLLSDPVERVRATAVRALGMVGEGEHAMRMLDACSDTPPVAAAALRSVKELEKRLDRRFRD